MSPIWYENTGHGTTQHECGLGEGPAGGDLDGDGQWEGLFRGFVTTGYSLVHLEKDTSDCLKASKTQSLAPLNGEIIGTLHDNSKTNIIGVQHHRYWGIGPINKTWLVAYSTGGWQSLGDIGLEQQSLEGQLILIDANNDGLKDLLIVPDTTYSKQGKRLWTIGGTIYRNDGSSAQDHFVFDSSLVFPARFTHNPDTVFMSSCFGDFNGDGKLKYGVLALYGERRSRVMFYEVPDSLSGAEYRYRADWSSGLPRGLAQIRLADLNNDGLSEFVGCLDGEWLVFTYRNDKWIETPLLPTTGSSHLDFVDLNNDGKADIYDPPNVWFNQGKWESK